MHRGGLLERPALAALPAAYAVTALAKIVLSSAVPIEPPTCWPTLTIAEAMPASLGVDAVGRALEGGREDAAHAGAEDEQRRAARA